MRSLTARITTPLPPLASSCLAELVGTYLLVLFGTGAVAAAVVTPSGLELWHVASVWGLGIAFAIYVTAAVSGAHLNPAVSLALVLFRRRVFPVGHLVPYWLSQLGGATLAGLTVFGLYRTFIARFETANGIVRGEPGSELSAMVFGEYFPNPAMYGTGAGAAGLISPLGAAAVEGFGTAVLVLVIFAVTDRRNASLPAKYLAPLLIGFTVAVLIALFAPLTQAGWNPARDFGPRIVAYFAGWGDIAIPGPSAGFWAYILGPLVGGPLGALAYETLIRRGLREDIPVGTEAGEDGL